MCVCHDHNAFQNMHSPERIWAISSVHGELDHLVNLHDALVEKLQPGDRIVYLGNYTGYGPYACETVDELLTFRRLVLSMPGFMSHDLIYLRGFQEELWYQLTQLQFTQHPVDLLLEMLGNGMGNTLKSYGINIHDGVIASREGIMPLTRWTSDIRNTLRTHEGHEQFMMHHKRGAYTNVGEKTPTLFVNEGACPEESPFEKVIRGYDPNREGVQLNCVQASLDGGCGFGGSLICAQLDAQGTIYELMEA